MAQFGKKWITRLGHQKLWSCEAKIAIFHVSILMYLLGPWQIFPAPNEMTEAIGKAGFWGQLEDMNLSKPTADAVTWSLRKPGPKWKKGQGCCRGEIMRSCNPIHAKLAASQLLSAVISANAVHELSITFSKKLHMQQSLLNHSLLRNEPVSLDQWNQPQLPTQNLRSIDHEMAQSNKIIITPGCVLLVAADVNIFQLLSPCGERIYFVCANCFCGRPCAHFSCPKRVAFFDFTCI